eukprot:403372320
MKACGSALDLQTKAPLWSKWNNDTDYDWIYSGKSKVTDAEMKKKVKLINSQKQEYLLIGRNCQTITMELESFANGAQAVREELLRRYADYTGYDQIGNDFFTGTQNNLFR